MRVWWSCEEGVVVLQVRRVGPTGKEGEVVLQVRRVWWSCKEGVVAL